MMFFPIFQLSCSQLPFIPFLSGTSTIVSKEFSRSITKLWERSYQHNKGFCFLDQVQNQSLCYLICLYSKPALTQETKMQRKPSTIWAKLWLILISEGQIQNYLYQTLFQDISLLVSWKSKPATNCWVELNGSPSKWRCLRPNTVPQLSARSTLAYTSATLWGKFWNTTTTLP